MYLSVDGIVCCCCKLDIDVTWRQNPGRDILLKNSKEALNHLKEHIYAGHKVPKYATDRLKEEIENDTKNRNKSR